MFMSSSNVVFCMPVLQRQKKKGAPKFTSFGFQIVALKLCRLLAICIDQSGFIAQNESTPHRLDDEQCKQGRRGVQADSEDEDGPPAVVCSDNACEWHQQRGCPLGGIQHAVI